MVTDMPPEDHEIFNLGSIALQRGGVLDECKLAFRTYGRLNATKSNAILFPTWYAARHTQNEWLIGEGRPLDTRRWFVVVPNMLANGLSSSPSNTPPPCDRVRFPSVTIYDNVMLQRRLLLERFGIERLALVIGRSMGALQTFQWGCLFPDAVERIMPFNGAARVSRHNYVFIAGLKAALTADAAWEGGDYRTAPVLGIKAFGRIYAGWMFSQAWYREELYRLECQGTLEDFLEQQWDSKFAQHDANNLLTQLDTWQCADISANSVFNGNFDRALGAIRARAIVMPSRSDLYFTPEDSAYEVARMPHAEVRVVPSIWGHRAGGPSSPPEDIAFVEAAVRELLNAGAP